MRVALYCGLRFSLLCPAASFVSPAAITNPAQWQRAFTSFRGGSQPPQYFGTCDEALLNPPSFCGILLQCTVWQKRSTGDRIMKILRNICIIFLLVIVLTLLFSSGGPLGGSVDLAGAAIASVMQQRPFPLEGGAYVSPASQKGKFADLMLAQGWRIIATTDTTQTFEKDDQRVCYAHRPVLGGFLLFELAAQ